jgi:hypothetical protein
LLLLADKVTICFSRKISAIVYLPAPDWSVFFKSIAVKSNGPGKHNKYILKKNSSIFKKNRSTLSKKCKSSKRIKASDFKVSLAYIKNRAIKTANALCLTKRHNTTSCTCFFIITLYVVVSNTFFVICSLFICLYVRVSRADL